MKSPVITLAELNTVYKDLIDRINVASVYKFKGEITITQMMNTDTKSDVAIGDIYEIHKILTENDRDIANTLNLQECDNIACKKYLTKGTKLSLNPDENNYWGNYWTEIGSYMQLADESHNGFVSTDYQKFSGHKEFTDDVTVGKTLTVSGSNSNTGNVTTSILNLIGGESNVNVNTLTATTLKVNDTATVQNIYGENTTINVIKGGTTTVNTIDGIGPDGNKDYADFKVNGTVTCGDFNLHSSNLTLNAATTVNSIQHESCILKPSGTVYCTDFISTSKSITANQVDSIIKQIYNSDAILNASGTVSCVNFDASGKSIVAQGAPSIIKNVNTKTGVLNVSVSSENSESYIKCSTFDATGQTIEAKQATSEIKNISSTTATLSGVSSVKCGTLDLGTYQLTVNSGTTFSSISKISGSTDPTLNTSGSITCGNFNNSSYSITTSNDITFSSINNIDSSTTKPSTRSILKSTGTISCTNFDLSKSSITSSMSTGITFSSIGNASKLSASGEIKCVDFDLSSSNISSTTSNQSITFSSITTGSNSTLNSTGKISCTDFSNTSGTITTTNTGNTTFSNITGSGTLNVSGTLSCKNLSASSGTGTVQVPTVNLGDGTTTIPITLNTSKSGTNTNQKYWSSCVVIGDTSISDPDSKDRGDLVVNGHIFARKVHNAVWNDLVDCIPVDEDVQLEYGYCYSFDGKKYHKSNKHCDPQFIGIHSDTSGMRMGERPCKTLDVAISGFVLAYVDHYKSGTPLVCGKNGRLEKATIFDKIFKPYRIIATYWKDETEEKYGPEFSKIKVNGRNWVKIK